MFYNARWYDPTLGRFAQADSIVPGEKNSQAWDRYSYGLNNPIRYNDPNGHCPICVAVLVGSFFIFNGTSDSYQPNLTAEELQSRESSVNLGEAITVSALSFQAPVVEALANLYDCASGNFCDPASLAIPGSSSAYSNVTNSYPNSSKFVRLVPEDIAEEIANGNYNITLSHLSNADTFISAAEDLANYRTQSSVADRLSLPSVSRTGQNALVGFNYNLNIGEIASPVNRTFSEFVGMGRTANGAREWVIPNLPIKDLPITNVYVRRLK